MLPVRLCQAGRADTEETEVLILARTKWFRLLCVVVLIYYFLIKLQKLALLLYFIYFVFIPLTTTHCWEPPKLPNLSLSSNNQRLRNGKPVE